MFRRHPGDLLTISLHEQLKLVISRNQRLIKQSWETGCLWQTRNVVIGDREILLNVNIDDVALFKSRNLFVWPVWVEIFNLPSKIRNSFCNNVLLCLWRGVGKPDWNFLLKKISIEMELSLQQKFFLDGLGECSLKFLICDMPAKASVCLLQQFNGYYGCPYCYMEGLYCNHRMLYPVRENFKIRKNSEYFQNARSKSFGVKGVSPISKFSLLI